MAIGDERYRDCAIGQDVDAMLGLDLDGAVGDGVIQVSTDLLDIDAPATGVSRQGFRALTEVATFPRVSGQRSGLWRGISAVSR
jgi:hypothetical protein